MSFTYSHYLIPTDSTYRPAPETLVRLIETLKAERWLIDPDRDDLAIVMKDHYYPNATRTGFMKFTEDRKSSGPKKIEASLFGDDDSDLKLAWPILAEAADFPLRYPLRHDPPSVDTCGNWYTTELHLANDFVYETGDAITPFEDISCPCGKELAYATPRAKLFRERIVRSCPNCNRPVDVSDKSVQVLNPWTGEPGELKGGAVYRFAIVIDLDKAFPDNEDKMVEFHPEFRGLIESVIKTDYKEFLLFY